MSNFMKNKCHVVETPSGITLQVRSRGEEEDGPVALLLHGLGVGSGYWDLPVPGYNTMDYLAEQGISAFAMDHRGYGGSSAASGGTVTVGNVLDDVLAVIDWVGVRTNGRPVGLVGHSWGGMVAVAVAAVRRHDISSLVTIGTPFRRLHSTFEERLALIRKVSPVNGWIPNVYHRELDQGLFAYDVEVLRAYQHLVESAYPRVPVGIIDDCGTLPHAAAAETLQLPTRLIYGTREQVVDRADCLDLLDALPAREKDLFVVGNSGHIMGLEKFSHSHVDRAVAGWLLDHVEMRAVPH